ncbi:hypothetical protein [Paenarthrobacter nicotinovorans]|uniref:hypothetical protein n=1 Tax=Paenarthrobacter nicotinovorans TaxID=29320 RepID=UPI0009C4E42A|nr:hypothetical protein [Paenarthrobacter nicotinovorans]MDI2019808.1 hypothetical protein [Paenarthrobacter nicotinovorans]SKB71296.1 hypothetical protein SAMN05660916_02249 [Arthrobacter sp. 31Cvi3.1E]
MVSAEQSGIQRIVAERMLELIDVRSPWHRTLWQLGTMQSLAEVLECTHATWDGTIPNDQAQKYLVQRSKGQVLADVGLGPNDVRQKLADKLVQLGPKKLAAGQLVLEQEIEELASRAKRGYLLRWKEHVEASQLSTSSVEKTARLIVSHFLDDGFDRRHIHGWIKAALSDGHDEVLTHLLGEGHTMCRQSDETYNFVVPFQRGNREHLTKGLEELLLSREEMAKVRVEAGEAAGPHFARSYLSRLLDQDSAAAVEQTFTARDPHAATARLDEWIRKVEARTMVGSGGRGIVFGHVVLDRTSMKVRDRRTQSGSVRVPSLDRHGLYAQELDAQLDNALGLLSSHQNLSPVASVATTWAAVEGLLGYPGAKGIESADGLAAIVACSFPRAELEDLLRQPLTQSAAEADVLKGIDEAEGSGRARTLLQALKAHGSGIFENPCDVAAAERILQVAAAPQATISRVRDYFSDVFRRLYYQRNFVMHAAKFDSVSLQSTIRSAPKLVAAGLDRVVHAKHVRTPAEPLGLAARARNEIDMLGTAGEREIFRLLK